MTSVTILRTLVSDDVDHCIHEYILVSTIKSETLIKLIDDLR